MVYMYVLLIKSVLNVRVKPFEICVCTCCVSNLFSTLLPPFPLPPSLPYRIWYPGPENLEWKRRYLEAGFIFVQDMVERGVMEEIVGHRVASPGAYLHEMPYPSYNEDL